MDAKRSQKKADGTLRIFTIKRSAEPPNRNPEPRKDQNGWNKVPQLAHGSCNPSMVKSIGVGMSFERYIVKP
jgi:hypothetical protein